MKVAILLLVISSSVAFRYNYVDSKIYSFAFGGNVRPGQFFDGQKLTGTHVELMKEVCCRAAKRCTAAFVPYYSCLDLDVLSPVLDNRWHDVCFLRAANPRRQASYAFSNISLFPMGSLAIVARNDLNITIKDLKKPRNNIKLVIPNALLTSEYNALELFQKDFFVKPENIIIGDFASPSDGFDEMLRQINDPCKTGGDAVGFGFLPVLDTKYSFKIVARVGDTVAPATLLVRKDAQGILDWWDYTLKRFMCSPDYAKFCKRMEDQFGANPVNCPDPSQVNCSDCTRPHRVPGCDCPKAA